MQNWNVILLNLILFLHLVAPAKRFLHGCYWDPTPERRVPWGNPEIISRKAVTCPQHSSMLNPMSAEMTLHTQVDRIKTFSCPWKARNMTRWRPVLYFTDTEFHTFFSGQVPISSDIHIIRTFPDMSGTQPSCRSWPDCSLRPFP